MSATQPVSGQPTHARPVPGTTGSSAGDAGSAPGLAATPLRSARVSPLPLRVCAIQGCGRPHSSRGYCASHYVSVRRQEQKLAAALAPSHPLLLWRIERGIGRKGLARRLGVVERRVVDLERGVYVSPARKEHYAACLGATVEELFGGNPGAEPAPAARVTAAGGVSLTSGNRNPSSQPPPPRESDGGVTEAHNDISGRPA